jgi:tRNA (cmo5U34)-methyltransferase
MSASVGHGIAAPKASWSFDGDVANNFVAHIRQSVPGYEDGHRLVCKASNFFCLPDSVCYEIGVSSGELIRKLSDDNSSKSKIRWIGIDNVPQMIDAARIHCTGVTNVELVCDDVRSFDFEKCDLIVSYYAIQFVPPRERQRLIDQIFESLNWGGGFIWFEKVRGPDARFQDMLTNMYNNFKLEQGFTPEEILAKTESLKSVLEPFSSQGNLDLLSRAGFKDVMSIYRNICFEGLVCIK